MLYKKILFIAIVSGILTSSLQGDLYSQSISGKVKNVNAVSNYILLTEDINLNGTKEIFSVSLIKKMKNNSYWINNGKIYEIASDRENTLLTFGDVITDSEGKSLISQLPADNGYIIRIEAGNKTSLYVSMADAQGNSISDELLLKWNKNTKTFDITN